MKFITPRRINYSILGLVLFFSLILTVSPAPEEKVDQVVESIRISITPTKTPVITQHPK